jgi:hypothetical protein
MRLLLSILIFAFPTGMLAQSVGLSAKAEKSQYRIGDWIDVTVDARVDIPVDSIRPALRDSLGLFEVLGMGRAAEGNRWTIRFATLDSGNVVLPPIPFVFRAKGDTVFQRAYSNSISFVLSGMAIDPKGEIKDIKQPMSGPWTFEDLLPYLIGFVVLVAAGIGLYFWYKRRQRLAAMVEEVVRPAIPAHVEALAALRMLEDKKLWQNGRIKEFYSEDTEIVRRFFERRWNIIALELTSDETLQQMEQIGDAQQVRNEMVQFFRTADLVKFAKHFPSPEDCTNELRWAYDIIRAMVPRATVDPAVKEEVTDAR